MQYHIVQNLKWPCRVIDVQLKKNPNNNSKFVIIKFGKYETAEFLRSVILPEDDYDYMVSEMQKRKYHTINRIAIRPENVVYHILTWDDVDRGICTREHIGEIQRDKDGNPIMFKLIVVFVNLDNLNRFTINEVLDKEYIEVNSPIVQNYMNFNNKENYLQQQAKKRMQKEREEEVQYCEMMDAFYEACENRRYWLLVFSLFFVHSR